MEYFAKPIPAVGKTSFDGMGEYAVEWIGLGGSKGVPVRNVGEECVE